MLGRGCGSGVADLIWDGCGEGFESGWFVAVSCVQGA